MERWTAETKNLFLELKFAYFRLLELNLITESFLELLYSLVTQFMSLCEQLIEFF